MPAESADAGQLDELLTEAVDDRGLMLDELSVAELVTLMNDRDATIAPAVRDEQPAIARAIEATAARMLRAAASSTSAPAPPGAWASWTPRRSRRRSAPPATSSSA